MADIAEVEIKMSPLPHTGIRDVLNFAKPERIRCIVKGSLGKFGRMTDPID